MNDTVVAIVSAFFVIGITVGIIAVVAMSALRTERRSSRGIPPEYGPGGQSPDAGWDDTGRDGHSRWPGDDDNDFSDR